MCRSSSSLLLHCILFFTFISLLKCDVPFLKDTTCINGGWTIPKDGNLSFVPIHNNSTTQFFTDATTSYLHLPELLSFYQTITVQGYYRFPGRPNRAMLMRSRIRATASFLSRRFATVSSRSVPQPLRQGYFYKDNRIGERQGYGEPLVLKDGRTIRFEIADEKDEELFLNQYLDGFTNQLSYMRSFNLKREDCYDFFKEEAETYLPGGGIMFGFHEDNLVCFRMVTYHKHADLPKMFGPLAKLGDPPPVAVFPKDFGALVDAQPYGPFLARFCPLMLELMEKQMGKFFPRDVKNVAYARGLFVHDEFQRNGISEYLGDVSDELAANVYGCNYVANITVATASKNMSKKREFKELFRVPYDQMYVHGELKFKEFWDNNDGWSANLRKIY